ncbi:hypothetical protein AVEN_2130-1 [Araneus ventricosus]|uniref:Uncharacterized protein n=1 Tax=Araneus ventricosus TaxID=182803 RepID=A0A4Y2EBV3_ARAVE|nr:hypothetical protein AVEN_2130-1 [Araneus ventricosus]
MIQIDRTLYQIRFRKKISPFHGMEDDKTIHSLRRLSRKSSRARRDPILSGHAALYLLSLLHSHRRCCFCGPSQRPLFAPAPLTFIVINRRSPVQIHRQLHLAAWAHTFF